MKAAFFDKTGEPEVIRYGDLPDPVPKAGEILVKVGAAALNPIDVYIRAGTIPMQLPQPFITGCDAAGAVKAVGLGVARFKVGDRVWGSNQGLLGRQGTCAEYVCASEDWFYPTPAEVSDAEAAAAALVGITAHLGLFRCAKLHGGETVFVNGGAGGVGSMVVQMAKAGGAKVVTTVGSAEKAELCRSWGADCVLNYKTDDIPAKVKEFTKGQGVNVWYETQREPDFARTVDLLAWRGRMIIMAGRQAQPVFPVGPFYVKDCSLFGFVMFKATPDEQRQCAADINKWLGWKKLRVPIGKTFPLAQTAAAHRLLEENTLRKAGTLTGKVVVSPLG
ncbi:MAG: NADPH:quinone reductase [Gemmataceae bacterium]|nr:NADPH:quinone reductase [Gemmataceae bacterium]MCI0743099.1 NADPH:quinone reductase [Gemmataceae bacterium]